jgi:hypothetical protein
MEQVVKRLLPYSGWGFTVRDAVNTFRVKDDPTGVNIPLLLPNPEKGLFSRVERFRFSDGATFDFRGDGSRTVNGTARTLANSNQRDTKGFKTTSALSTPIELGKLTVFGRWKIDWIFARGYQRSPRDTKASYRMAPHFPRTLEELGEATVDPETGLPARLSDHSAMTVLLPLTDTCREGSCTGDAIGPLQFEDTTWIDAHAQ